MEKLSVKHGIPLKTIPVNPKISVFECVFTLRDIITET